MKVSIIISDISKTGGTERAVVTLANMLCKKKYNVFIISLSKTENEKSYYKIDDKVSLVFLNNDILPHELLRKIKWSLTTVLLLRKYFKNTNEDFIISTGHNNNWLLPFVKTNNQTKLIACEHIVYSSIPKVSRLFMRLTYRFLDKIVVLSEKANQSFYKYSKVVVIPNAVSFKTEKVSQLIEKQILMVGRLSTEKGLERLVLISTHLKQKFPDWKIIIVGDGPERNRVEKLIKEADLIDFVILKGASTDVKSYYLNSSIYIMTSYFEAFPMVLLEAQSFGLPVVVFDCPEGPNQIIDNNNGFLVENGDIIEFSEKVAILIKDEILRKEFSINAKNNSNKYSEENIIARWTFLFKEMKII
ncbi:glycosyltransferase family 4 protein [Flavobacterium sp. PS2]|uniref:glycosyltransferase family 4 protein n=1 Tax=Flavobacterium sp. PS2 TaxID=3384157 RepID=UPI00390C5882